MNAVSDFIKAAGRMRRQARRWYFAWYACRSCSRGVVSKKVLTSNRSVAIIEVTERL